MTKKDNAQPAEKWLSTPPKELSVLKSTVKRLFNQCGALSQPGYSGPRLSLDSQREKVLELIGKAQALGLVNKTGMGKSGLLDVYNNHWKSEPALQHIAHRIQRALNILANPNGYIPPARPLYNMDSNPPIKSKRRSI